MTEDQFARFVDYVEERFQQFATKDDLQRLATKDDLQRFATKDDLQRFATKDDVQRLATKDDLGSLREEMRERFEIVHDRVVALDNGNEDLRVGVAMVREQVNELTVKLNGRIDKLDALARETNAKLIDLKEEVQQRFRVVTERLSA